MLEATHKYSYICLKRRIHTVTLVVGAGTAFAEDSGPDQGATPAAPSGGADDSAAEAAENAACMNRISDWKAAAEAAKHRASRNSDLN